ncbi:MAG: biotin-dependent carboxyltransferase family protein [Acidimicrobiales bacterium]
MSGGRSELLVLRAGSLTTVQDRGRPGLAHLAIPPSGALDPPAWRLANRLVGNGEDAAALETTLTGVTLLAQGSCAVAVTGARAPVTVAGRPAGWGVPLILEAGQVLDVGPASAGVRSYVGVSGGIAVAPVFGSRSTDVLSELGPPRLRDGDTLPLGPVRGSSLGLDFAPYPLPPDHLSLILHPGPRQDWLSGKGLSALGSEAWRVAPASNRVGLRLDGPALPRARLGELPSEGIVTGAVQVPPDGHPLIFLADHPTTGGYPVVGVVDVADLAACAQARPGAPVDFRAPATLQHRTEMETT